MRDYPPFAFLGLLLASGCAGTLTVAAAGDLQLGAERTTDPLGALATVLPGDLRLANLEGPLVEAGTTDCKTLVHGRSEQATWLRGRLDAVSVVNNHFDDCGLAGVLSTDAALHEANVIPIIASLPSGLKRKNHAVELFARYYAPDRPLVDAELVRQVRGMSKDALVIVSLHWGHTGVLLPSDEQRAFARQLVDAGARFIVGHGPHTPMGVEKLNGPHGVALIAYSLGNLAFDCDCTDVEDAYTIELTFDRRRVLVAAKLHPLRAGLRRAVEASREPELVELLTKISAELGTVLTEEGETLTIDLR